MEIRRRTEQKAEIFDLSGDISLLNCRDLRRALDQAVTKDPEIVAVNLKEVSFIDSSGIGCLIAAYTDLNKRGGRLVLVHVPEAIVRTLEITNVVAFFEIFDSMADVLAAPNG